MEAPVKSKNDPKVTIAIAKSKLGKDCFQSQESENKKTSTNLMKKHNKIEAPVKEEAEPTKLNTRATRTRKGNSKQKWKK